MRLSLEWLRALVDLGDRDPQEIAHRLTMSTAEVEDIDTVELDVGGVVAEVVELDGRLVLHDGSTALPTPVPAELATGDKVVVGPDGAPRRPLLGEDELWRVDPGEPAGRPLAELVRASHVVFEIDNKSLTHRPDLFGHYGFARELAGIFGGDLVELAEAKFEQHDDFPAIEVAIESSDCDLYSAVALTCDAVRPAPLLIQERLAVLEQRSRGLAVDVTNYVMLETAQPLHAFDREHVRRLRVAPAGESRPFPAVDGVTRELAPEDLMIWSQDAPIALAGIIGGADASVGLRTREIVLESANFAAARVRRTQMRLGLRTDAGRRFEKTQPVGMARVASARAVHLLLAADPGATVVSQYSSVSRLGDEQPRTITVAAKYFTDATGIDIPPARAVGVLRSLRFDVLERGDDLVVTVPPFRSSRDIGQSHDLLEEVARIVGYDNIEPVLPEAPVRSAPLGESLVRERHVRSALAVAHRFDEVRTYHWFDDSWLAELDFVPSGALELRNPTSVEFARLRTTVVPNVLAVARSNSQGPGEGRVFEIGHVYETEPGADEPKERATVAGVVWDRARSSSDEQLLRRTRGAIEDLLVTMQPVEEPTWRISESAPPWAAPGVTLSIRVEREEIGTVALASPKVARAVGRGLRVAVFELDLDAIGRVSPKRVFFRLPTSFPQSWFDLSFQWSKDRGYAALTQVLDIDDPMLVRREFVDVYEGAPGQASYTFRFWLEAADRTLAGEEVQRVRSRLTEVAEAAGARVPVA